MKKYKFLTVLFLIFSIATLQIHAEEVKGTIFKKNSPKASVECFAPSRNTLLELNNVRALLKTNGTMWFLDGNARYEVPKGSGKTSLFSSSLWIGGYTKPMKQGNLYMAAMRFAQRGNDYWTGPISMADATITPASCAFYDQFYRITRSEVERHKLAFLENDEAYKKAIPKSILNWPAHGRPGSGESMYLAPFVDVGNGEPNTYEPELGDYPYYDIDNDLCPWTEANLDRAKECYWHNENGECDNFGKTHNPKALPVPYERFESQLSPRGDNKMIYADHVLKGDETVFWFLNDVGGTHSETKNPYSIGLEIRVQAFAFATNDELNKMTFYSYEIINRGKNTLYDTYFSQWCDPDLGYAYDDYVGCDVVRGLGYCYNGKEVDGNGEAWAYGPNPPVVGLDFFQGPYIDPDGSDNPKFHKELANANGNPAEKEYCNRFVGHIFNNPHIFIEDEQLLNKYYVIPLTEDTVRWNDQFAINGVNFGDGIVDNERFGMRAFTYHNNESGPQGDPDVDFQYYNYLTGRWKDGNVFTYGGTGYETDPTGKLRCDFVFPEGTDYCNWGTKGASPGEQYNHGGRSGNWSERTPLGINGGNNPPNDRRWMQSAGPFTLQEGSCNYVTVGVPWARSLQGGVESSIALLMVADDKCQALFENCFKVLDGPDAPTLTIREYDQKLILLLTNSPLSNNANEDYSETDPSIPDRRIDIIDTIIDTYKDSLGNVIVIYGPQRTVTTLYDRSYRFEGYQIYQVIGPEVGANDLENPDLARLVRQYDIENYDSHGSPIGRLINWEFDEYMQLSVPKEKVNGSNTGIQHSFEITQDVFASGSKQLVNYKTYYFIAVAYAYNEYLPFNMDPNDLLGLQGQKLPYLRGRKTAEGRSVIPIAGIPHPPTLHGGGATMNSDYGAIPYIIRVDGQGNGGIPVDLSNETIDKIMAGGDNNDWRVRELKYAKNAGPLNIKVIDPLRVKPFDFTLTIIDPIMAFDTVPDNIKNKADVTNNSYWVLSIDQTTSDNELIDAGMIDIDGKPIRRFVSQTTIGQYYEQIIMPLGISVSVANADFVSRDPKVGRLFSQVMRYYRGDLYKIRLALFQTEKIDIPNDIIFEDNNRQWITGLVDDNSVHLPSNWIRAGSYNLGTWSGDNSVVGNFTKERLEDFHFPTVALRDSGRGGANSDRGFKDYLGKFGTLCGGTWAPYVLTSPYDNGPQAKYTEPETVNANEVWTEPAYGTSNTNSFGLHNYYNFKGLYSYFNQPSYNQTLTNLYSVNVVLTPDKSKWTRCIVLESCQDASKSEGGALKNEPRKAKSVGKDGKHDGSTDGFGPNGDEGMGWFPGYAINVETGERLNIMFSENSDSELNEFGSLVNGRDMLFNPTSTYAITKYDLGEYLPAGTPISKTMYDRLYLDPTAGPKMLLDMGIEKVWGGMHYVYVCGSSGNTCGAHFLDTLFSGTVIKANFLSPGRRNFNLRDTLLTMNHRTPSQPLLITWGGNDGYLDVQKQYPFYDCGPYDEGRWLVQKFKQVLSYPVEQGDDGSNIIKRKYTKMQLYNNVMYTHIPMQPEDSEQKSYWLTTDVTFKLRVTRPYMRYISRWYESPELRNKDYTVPDEFEQYKGFPVYKLSTKGLEPTFNDARLYQSILDNINIVPNPYYGSSLYETNVLETMVKITNLPTDLKNNAPVTINIFTVGGILVRTLTKGDSETSYVNWDLKNYANIPVASGVYIIHVNCPGIGEKMLKFFCTMRQTDLNIF